METQKTKSRNWIAQMELLFKACADQTRLRILNMLAYEREICVCHLVDVLKTNQPKVSRHLAYLKRAGLVMDRKDGLWVYYRLAVPLAEHAERVLHCLNSCCDEVPEMQQDVLSLKTIMERRPLAKLVPRAKTTISFPVTTGEEAQERSEIQVELL